MSNNQDHITNSQQKFPDINNADLIDENHVELKTTTHSGLININYNREYVKEKINKFKEENNSLKSTILAMDSEFNQTKANLNEQINSLRNENLSLNEKVTILNEEISKLNIQIQSQNFELENLTKSSENITKDREILLSHVQELNDMISNTISPKLIENENDLSLLQEQNEKLQKKLITIQNKNLKLVEDIKQKNKIIKILTTENKKLLKEIKNKYDRDLSFIQNIENYGINQNTRTFNKDLYDELASKYDSDTDIKDFYQISCRDIKRGNRYNSNSFESIKSVKIPNKSFASNINNNYSMLYRMENSKSYKDNTE